MTYKKSDKTQQAIVKALRDAGVFVSVQSSLGHGAPDLLTCYKGRWLPIEVKSGPKNRLEDDQIEWWAESGVSAIVVYTASQALALHGIQTP